MLCQSSLKNHYSCLPSDVSLVLATASSSLSDVIDGGVPRTMGDGSYHLRCVARIIGILGQNVLVFKWLLSFWSAHVDPVSVIRNVKDVGYEPFMFIDSIGILNQFQYESVRHSSLA